MRLDRDHDRADSRAPVTLRPRPIPSPRDAAIRRAIPVVIAGFAVAGSALAVLALYWLVAHDGSGVTSPYFDSDVALLTGVAIAACGALALMVRRNRAQQEEIERLDLRLEDFSDRAWEVKEAEDRAKSFLEAQGDVIIRRDSAGCVTYVNDAFCKLAGRGRDELIGSAFILPLVAQGELAVLPDGTRVHDQQIETSEGPRWIAWREVPVRADSEGRTETQGVGRDVTDRALVERALADARDQADAANRAKSRFLAMVSHEIRTPLNGILGMADLLFDTPLSPAQASYVKAVKGSGDTLLSLIGEILDFSKIEAGKLDLDVRPFRLATLVEDVVELLAPRAQAKDIEIASFVDDRLPAELIGDAARLRQVLLNLAGNAVKFTEAGGVSVTVEPAARRPGEVTFRVSDTGIGIAPDAQARIFQEFEQADGGSTRRHGGTGLGLAISQRIVERMGGRIKVGSAPQVGSTFRFTIALPPAESQTAPVRPRLDGAALLIVAPTQKTVAASLLARRLAVWGARSCVVANAATALARLDGQEWDAVMVDRAIGPQAAEAIARAATRASPRRIVLVTPGDRGELPDLKDAGFTGYLVKPVRAASLAARFGIEDSAFEIQSDAAAPDREPENPAARGAGLAILVAEDNEINALLARALLTRLGHRPELARDGAQAVDSWLAARAAGEPYDLVLMDVHMPEVDGIEATRRIRAAEAAAGGARIPIVALTANAFSDDRDACLAAGMDAFLTKPLDRERLAELLARGRATIAA